jgi:hypothetical protein
VLGNVVGAPEFPSLRKEGSNEGGYDIKIPLQAVAVFFQFKVPQVLQRDSYLRPTGFPLPYYRIPLRTKTPNQHKLLLDLESRNELVFYAAPKFHQDQSLDRHYRNSEVASNSAFFLPSDVGILDEKAHHIAYCSNSSVGWICSQPTRMKSGSSFQEASVKIHNAVSQAPSRSPDEFMDLLARTVVDVINQRVNEEIDDNLIQGHQIKVKLHNVYEAIENLPDEQFEVIEKIPDEQFESLNYDDRFSTISRLVRTRVGCEILIFAKPD